MDDLTIPPEVVEAMARAACKSVEDREHGRNPYREPAWAYLGYPTQETFIDAAWPNYSDQCLAAARAMLKAWPFQQYHSHCVTAFGGYGPGAIILPLPQEKSNG